MGILSGWDFVFLVGLVKDLEPAEIRMKAGGGEVEICATATSVWPINALEIVVNGKVVADSRDK